MNSSKENRQHQYVILYFQVHQPRRLNALNSFDTGDVPRYFDDDLNASIVKRISQNCYLPANQLLLDLINDYPAIRIAFSLSGSVIEQFERHAPEVLESFKALARTGSVEFLSETYYHSLSGLVKSEEFEEQILLHAEKIYELFGVRPTIFRNTGFVYNNEIGKRVAMLGFQGIFAEGDERVLGGLSPHDLYCHPEHTELKIILRNYRLSDDIAFRFMEGGNALPIEQYLAWLNAMPIRERLINLAMAYETFGEHHKAGSGIFDFLRRLLENLAMSDRFKTVLPSEAVSILDGKTPLTISDELSWAGVERDFSAWLGSEMQKDAFNSIMKLESEVKQLAHQELLRSWRFLQTSDHFHHMSVKADVDGSPHSRFTPFPSSYEAFINYMNVVNNLTLRIHEEMERLPVQHDHDLSSREAERQTVKSTTPVWVMQLEAVPPGRIPDIER